MGVRWALAAVLVLFAALQLNDPDGLLWVGVYGSAAVWCIVAAQRPGLLSRVPALKLAAIASVVLYLVGFVFEIREFNAAFLSRSMMAPGVEATREAFGLLICAAVTAYVVWADGRRVAGASR